MRGGKLVHFGLAAFILTPPSGPTFAQSWTEINRNSSPALIYIVTERENLDNTNRETITSSGFLVGGIEQGAKVLGYGITVAHGLPEAGVGQTVRYKASLASRDAPLQELHLIDRDARLDVALFLIEIPVGAAKGLSIDPNPAVGSGSDLGALGFSAGGQLRFSKGVLSNPLGYQGRWMTTLELNQGDSGGPVFDGSGRVVGMAWGGRPDLHGITYVIPSYLLARSLALVPKPSALKPAVPRPSDPEAKQTFYRVVGVSASDPLSVRVQPNASALEVHRLGPETRQLTRSKCTPTGWCLIALKGQELGYASAKFLAEEPPGSEDACERIESESQGRFSVTGVKRNDTLKIRRERFVRNDNVVAEIPSNAADVQVGVCLDGWCVVKYRSSCGFSSVDFLVHTESRRSPFSEGK